MDRELDELITRYVDVAAELFPRVAKHLGVSIPIANREWADLRIEQRGSTTDGIDYFKHGYGVAMTDGNHKIDLDLNLTGQIDGFDAWRLFEFARSNKLHTSFNSHYEIESALQVALKSDELEYPQDKLYRRK